MGAYVGAAQITEKGKIQKYSLALYIFNILLLISVFVIGDTRLGARRWIDLGPIEFAAVRNFKNFNYNYLTETLLQKFWQ